MNQHHSPLFISLAISLAIWTVAALSCLCLLSQPVFSEQVEHSPIVLDPDKYFGQAQLGYAAAKKIPDICAKLFCYCGCDLTDEHTSLLDCFTSEHGADCNICQEEAILALKMKNEGKSLAEIQKAIDTRYLKEYEATFATPSEALKKYRAQRLWSGTTESDNAQTAEPKAANKENGVGKNKPVKGCCGGS